MHHIAKTLGWLGGLIAGTFAWIRRQFSHEPKVLTKAEKKQRVKELRKHRKAA